MPTDVGFWVCKTFTPPDKYASELTLPQFRQ